MGITVGIVGCGVGGLALGTLLARQGVRVVIHERFEAAGPVGSGLVIQPVGQRVLARLGVLEELLAAGVRIERMLGHEVRGARRVLDVRYDGAGAGRFGLALHRATLFEALHGAARAAGVEIVTGAEVVGVTEAPGRRLELAGGGRSGPFDLIVNAGGARSALSPEFGRVLSFGALWGTVPAEGLPPVLRQRYRRASKMLGVLPVGRVPGRAGPQATIFWSLPQTAEAAWRATPLADWHMEVAALWPEFAELAAGITTHDDLTFARYRHGSLRRVAARELVHIGDAAHRASPQLGQGANMALVDAAVLAKALEGHAVDAALRRHARARALHVALYQGMSAIFTPFYQSESRVLPILRDRVMMPLSLIPPMPLMLGRLVGGDLWWTGMGPDAAAPAQEQAA
ncbi:FAD-dependent oxidoreductase [Pontivivens ytuae]|uniref:FAD-dependent oxidoreductase n=1 Tax=Pontivivens ytuae TaxID=2789856 RepID=UPI001E3860B1|nr:NAD(P)/FAD-dependent oxidoreductase [Pontivivens ytuae]